MNNEVIYLEVPVGISDSAILVFDVNSIPDNLTLKEFTNYIKATKTVPYQGTYSIHGKEFETIPPYYIDKNELGDTKVIKLF